MLSNISMHFCVRSTKKIFQRFLCAVWLNMNILLHIFYYLLAAVMILLLWWKGSPKRILCHRVWCSFPLFISDNFAVSEYEITAACSETCTVDDLSPKISADPQARREAIIYTMHERSIVNFFQFKYPHSLKQHRSEISWTYLPNTLKSFEIPLKNYSPNNLKNKKKTDINGHTIS